MLVFEDKNQPDWTFIINANERFLVVCAKFSTMRKHQVLYADIGAGINDQLEFKPLVKERSTTFKFIHSVGDKMYFSTKYKAKKSRVLEFDISKPIGDNWKPFLERDDSIELASRINNDTLLLLQAN